MFHRDIYIKRRKKLKDTLKSGTVLIMGHEESPINFKNNTYPFIQDSTFNYYFGIHHPGLIGIIDIDSGKDYIFGSEYTLDDIIWMGKLKLLKEMAEESGVDQFLEKDTLKDFLKTKEVLFTPQYKSDNILFISEILSINPFDFDSHISEALTLAIINQRNIKSTEEIESIEDAVNLTRDMHFRTLKMAKDGMREVDIVTEIETIPKYQGGHTCFTTICSKNGNILHNHNYVNTLKNGDLLLLDCGAKNKEGYCGDMTSTMPIGRKFNTQQRDIYSIVINMFDKAKSLAKPGVTYKEVHLAVAKTMVAGLIELGLFKGNIEDIVTSGAHALFFPHGLGHMLGLEVHDMESLGETLVGYDAVTKKSTQFGLKSLRLGRTLEEGFVFTIEPGIYFIPELFEKWKNNEDFKKYLITSEIEKYLDFGGVRFERNFLITSDGNKQFGNPMPKTYQEIEEFMNS